MKLFIALATSAIISISAHAGEPISQDEAIAIVKKKYARSIRAPFGVAYSATPFRGGWCVKAQRILDYDKPTKTPIYEIGCTFIVVSSTGEINKR